MNEFVNMTRGDAAFSFSRSLSLYRRPPCSPLMTPSSRGHPAHFPDFPDGPKFLLCAYHYAHNPPASLENPDQRLKGMFGSRFLIAESKVDWYH